MLNKIEKIKSFVEKYPQLKGKIQENVINNLIEGNIPIDSLGELNNIIGNDNKPPQRQSTLKPNRYKQTKKQLKIIS